LLEDQGVEYTYRDYKKDPLSRTEIQAVLKKLRLGPRDLLRKNDKAYKELGLDGSESDAALVAHMAEHPGLLQRPIGVVGRRAVVGRPVERLLELL